MNSVLILKTNNNLESHVFLLTNMFRYWMSNYLIVVATCSLWLPFSYVLDWCVYSSCMAILNIDRTDFVWARKTTRLAKKVRVWPYLQTRCRIWSIICKIGICKVLTFTRLKSFSSFSLKSKSVLVNSEVYPGILRL